MTQADKHNDKMSGVEHTEGARAAILRSYKSHALKSAKKGKVKPGFQKDGGWIGKNMIDEPHAKFHYGK